MIDLSKLTEQEQRDLLDAVENQEIAALVAARDASRGEESVSLDEAIETLGIDPKSPATEEQIRDELRKNRRSDSD